MNKKLETIGRLFLDKFLIKYDIYIDRNNNTIEYVGDDIIPVRDLYFKLQEIFDYPEMMDYPNPLMPVSVFSGAEVANRWRVNFNGIEYKNGDVIPKI